MHVPPKEHRERKPFQAFRRANDLRKQKAKDNQAEVRVGNPWEGTHQPKWLKTGVGFLIIGLVIAAGYGIWVGYSKFMKYEVSRSAKMEKAHATNDLFNYDFLVNSGWGEYNASEFTKAKREFEKALKIYPNEKEAARGLASSLVKLCETEKLFCKEAEEWRAYYNKQF